ncbi:MAG TPA: hypothetical protein VL025_14320 [Thermoanaerobaculia bacterium]|nr:hypothetical protein [Thermoanaerobaculia bacterium]
MLNPNKIPIYAALRGAGLDVPSFDFGHGVVLSRVDAYLPAPLLTEILPQVPEVNHPALRALAARGPGIDLSAQLFIPAEFNPHRWLDRVNAVWWMVTLLRLRSTPEVQVPLLSSEPFSGTPRTGEGVGFWPVEIEARRLPFEPDAPRRISADDLLWIEAHWFHAGRLVVRNVLFNDAVKALDKAYSIPEAPASLAALWESLESLFGEEGGPGPGVPGSIASFLTPEGLSRGSLREGVSRLYEARSAADAGHEPPEGFLAETYAIVKRVFLKIIEEDRVPTREEIEAGRFGAGLN